MKIFEFGSDVESYFLFFFMVDNFGKKKTILALIFTSDFTTLSKATEALPFKKYYE